MRLHCVWCWPEWEEGPASAFWPCHPPGQPGRTTINILLQFNPFLIKNYIYVSCISLHLFSLEVKSEHLIESESLYWPFYRIVLSIITLPQELGFWWFYKIQDTLYSVRWTCVNSIYSRQSCLGLYALGINCLIVVHLYIIEEILHEHKIHYKIFLLQSSALKSNFALIKTA